MKNTMVTMSGVETFDALAVSFIYGISSGASAKSIIEKTSKLCRSSLNCMIGYLEGPCRSFTMHVLKHHRGRSMLHVPVHRPVISTAGPAVDQLIGGKKGSRHLIPRRQTDGGQKVRSRRARSLATACQALQTPSLFFSFTMTRSRPPRPARGGDDDGDGTSSSLQMHNVTSSSRSARIVGGMPEDTPLLAHGPVPAPPAFDERSAASSRMSMSSAVAPFPWILSNLSNRLIPGDTELIDDDGSYASVASSIDDSADAADDHHEADPMHEYEYSNGRNQSFSRSPDGSSRRNSRHHHAKGKHLRRVPTTPQRRIFLFLTEPQTSIASFIFFVILVVAITFSCVLMMLQTMPSFQFKPDDCVICGGTNEYYSDNDDAVYTGPPLPDLEHLPIDCECPPIPLPWTVLLEDCIIWFFTVEWILRVLCYEPPDIRGDHCHSCQTLFKQKISYCLEWTTLLDALAIFPYYIERYEETNGLLSLRLLRLFRVFQLLRLGKYNTTFLSLMNVLVESILSFNILLIVLVFGAAFFGSMIYWMEKGTWKYTTYTDPPSFAYMRIGADGETEEPTPFTSIPAAFWWFIVTATTGTIWHIYILF